MMEKYGDLNNEGVAVKVVSGPHKGQQGFVKTAASGRLTLTVPGGEIVVDETAVESKATT